MFFNNSLREIFTRLPANTLGMIFGCCAATVWVSYGVAQQILMLLYILCTIALMVVAKPLTLLQLADG